MGTPVLVAGCVCVLVMISVPIVLNRRCKRRSHYMHVYTPAVERHFEIVPEAKPQAAKPKAKAAKKSPPVKAAARKKSSAKRKPARKKKS